MSQSSNQDAVFCDDMLGIYCVADGVGGMTGGAIASKLAANSIIHEIKRINKEFNTWSEEILGTVLLNLNDLILDYGRKNTGLAGLCTTLSCIIVENQTDWWIIHSGDSRIYGVSRDGEIIQLTTDQTLAEERIRIGLPPENENGSGQAANTLTNYLGASKFYWYAKSFDPADYDLFLLCTDGLTKQIDKEILTAIIMQHRNNPEIMCDCLITTARSAGSLDDISVIVVITEAASK